MAWIEERRRTDGGVSARVMWRLGGRRGAPREKETFSAGSDAQNRARADGFKQMVDAAGQHWPDGWVKGEGFVRVRAEVRHHAPPSFAAVGEEYVRQIVDLSPGQRKRYLAQIRLLAGIEVRGVQIFGRKIDAIAERDIKAWLIDWDRSLKTKANYHGLLFGVFNYAAEQQHVTVNPCARTAPKRSRVRQSQAELRFLTEEELRTAVRLAGKHGDLLTFAVSTGLRFGLPAAYVASHVDLGYAVTAHRAQGITVDSSHVVVSGSTTRENFYVSMTRGRASNIAYVGLDQPDDSHAVPKSDEVTASTVLFGMLQHSGAELSAHQTIEDEQERWSSIAQLAAEYNTIASEAQRDRWITELEHSGLASQQMTSVVESDSFGALTAELRRAEANHHDIADLLPTLVSRRGFDDAEDIGAVLLTRLQYATARPKHTHRRRPSRMIVGLIPVVGGPIAEDAARGLRERQQLMESRASALVEVAMSGPESWLARLPQAPVESLERQRWMTAAKTVAAYRDRYGVTSQNPLGATAETDAQSLDRSRARQAIRRIEAVTGGAVQREGVIHGTEPTVLG